MTHAKVIDWTLLALAAIGWGCSGSETPKTAASYPPTPGMTPASAPEPAKRADLPTRSQISISEGIKRVCGISDSDAYFAFDSAELTAQAERVAKELATCFTTGGMKGKRMRLVGHADPRGTNEYNLILGQHRADNFKEFITKRGLAPDRAETTSRGEMDAKGYNEDTWALDRRVDVLAAVS